MYDSEANHPYPEVLIRQEGFTVVEPALTLFYRGQEDLKNTEKSSAKANLTAKAVSHSCLMSNYKKTQNPPC